MATQQAINRSQIMVFLNFWKMHSLDFFHFLYSGILTGAVLLENFIFITTTSHNFWSNAHEWLLIRFSQ